MVGETMGWEIHMTVLPLSKAAGISSAAHTDPAVSEFYEQTVHAIDAQPDGASIATAVTGLYEIRHKAARIREDALMRDIRRLSADDSSKASMLAFVARSTGRAHEELVRLTGQLHHHQAAESRLNDLAVQLADAHPTIAAQIREALQEAAQPAPPATGPVILAHTPDPRWTVGWFATTGDSTVPLTVYPFCGWVLVADHPREGGQLVQSSFLVSGVWLTKREMEERGLKLQRMD